MKPCRFYSFEPGLWTEALILCSFVCLCSQWPGWTSKWWRPEVQFQPKRNQAKWNWCQRGGNCIHTLTANKPRFPIAKVCTYEEKRWVQQQRVAAISPIGQRPYKTLNEARNFSWLPDASLLDASIGHWSVLLAGVRAKAGGRLRSCARCEGRNANGCNPTASDSLCYGYGHTSHSCQY